MKTARVLFWALACWALGAAGVRAQDGPVLGGGRIAGSFQLDAQTYTEDSVIGAPAVDEKMRMNSFLNFDYTLGGFSAGARYEAYLPRPLLGIDPAYGNGNGSGLATRYISYTGDWYKIRVGNFYEQFGSGMTLRSWWEPTIGWDNAMDGVQIQANPVRGLYLKGVYGRMRLFFNQSAGVVRGADAELDLNEALDTLWKGKLRVRVGGSVVSRYQADDNPRYKLPENVAAVAGRLTMQYEGWSFSTEYVRKSNDPSLVNAPLVTNDSLKRANIPGIYRPGEGLFLTLGYSRSGFGASISAKRLDNIDFRADRNQTGQNVQVNFLPPLAKQHTYRLPTLYIYATQPNGEMGFKADVFYRFPKDSWIGGPYGALLSVNYSNIHGIDTTGVADEYGYESDFFALGKRLFYEDFNVEFQRKWNSRLKSTFTYMRLRYQKDQILGLSGFGELLVNVGVGEFQYKTSKKTTLRWEIQYMDAAQAPGAREPEFGAWWMALAELTFAPHFFIAASDEYNFNNSVAEKRTHYYSLSGGYIGSGTRVSLGYSRQRAGIICSGGICRLVPATNGVSLSISSTF